MFSFLFYLLDEGYGMFFLNIDIPFYWQDLRCSERYCRWCGSSNDLLSCTLCELLFCLSCIKRNIRVEYLPEGTWKCCSCSPDLLQQLTLELEKAVGSPESTVSSSDSDTDNSDDEIGDSIRYLNTY